MADKDSEQLDGGEVQREEEERKAAVQLGEEMLTKAKTKLENKLVNSNPVGLRLSENALKSLDGTVKKNSAFQRKLRSLTEQQRSNLTSDLKMLNLSKYLQEVAISIVEAKLKLADVGCAIHLCTLLHQRYADFSELLLESLQRVYHNPIGHEDDKSSVVSKYRLGFRFIGELVLAGVVDEEVGVSLLQDMVSMLIKADNEGHPYLSVMVSFARHFAEDMMGILPRKQRTVLSKYNVQLPQSELLPRAKQEEFHQLFKDYFSSISKYLEKEHKGMHKRERRNHHLLTTKGEIPEERQAENETAQKAYDKLLTSVSTLAEVLDEDMPDLPEYQAPQEDSEISIELQLPSLGESGEAGPNALWEDEDTRQFYEGITDIRPFIPAILLEERRKSSSESADDEPPHTNEAPTDDQSKEGREDEMDEQTILEQMIKDTEDPIQDEEEGVASYEHLLEGSEDKSSVLEPGSPAALFEQFTIRLPTMLNRKLVDELAVEFCMTLNTKICRKKLAKALFSVEKNRMDLLPFYSRLVATLSPCVDDVAPTLLEILLGDLRHQIRKKDQVHIHTKLKNIRLLAELTKFGICPKPEAMKCITLLMRDFTHHHIDMACLFLEHCGRFLLRSPDSHLRAKALLEILLRKKKVQHLDGRQRSLVENALYYANPPEASQISVVEEHPMHQYIKKLLYKELNKMNTEKILKQVRKLDWRDLDIFHFTVSCLSHIWKVKYNNIHCVANLLAGLKSYQEEAVIRVVDAVLEDTRVGLELNLSKFNQRRVSNIKFIGELYAYQLLESNVIFKTLYLLLQFGSSPDGAPSPLDPYDSYFRVRLICILLDTCGQYFDRGSSKKRLDTFLVYFQCYIFSKKQPQPLEVENLVSDTLESLRPQLELFKTPQAAYEAALELERLFRDKIGNSEDATAEESDEEEEEQRDSGRGQMEEEDEDEEGEDEDDEEVHTMETPDTFEQDPVLKAAPTLIKCPEDDSFVATFEKMMNEDIQTRKIENLKVPNMDIVVPMYLRGPTKDSSSLIEREGEMKMMKFKVMTRKGNKQQLKELNIPLDSDLTLGLRDTRQAKTEDHEVMKRRVLEHEQRQEEEEYKAAVAEEIESQMKSASKNSSSSQPYKKQPSSTAHHQPHHYRPHDVEGSQQQSQGYQGQGPGRGGYHHGNRGRGNRGRGWRGGGSGRGGGRGGGGNYRQN